MAAIGFKDRTISNLIDHYVDSRGSSETPISTSHALRALRTALPGCDLSDREIVDLVAAAAIARGQNVSFDNVSKNLAAAGDPEGEG